MKEPIGKRAIVVSHERSGTHFLMNTLSQNFGYQSSHWIDFDNLPVLLYVKQNVFLMINRILSDKDAMNMIIKSHHEHEYFNGLIDEMSEVFHIFYIYRNTDDVMRSFRKHIVDIKDREDGWVEGPMAKTVEEFKNAQPEGACLRYQFKQYKNMQERHEKHVEGWLSQKGVIHVKYEDLNKDFENTVKNICLETEMPLLHGQPLRPSKANTVQKGLFQREEVFVS